ncbi:MAG: hypothetical protein IJ454_02420 [Clostridia bacterium]|nr:hypothetical protein [Clostridia bacterium]
MLKYIVVAVLVVLLICNYTADKLLKLVLKREPSEKQVIVLKLVLYVVMLIGVIFVFLTNK